MLSLSSLTLSTTCCCGAGLKPGLKPVTLNHSPAGEGRGGTRGFSGGFSTAWPCNQCLNVLLSRDIAEHARKRPVLGCQRKGRCFLLHFVSRDAAGSTAGAHSQPGVRPTTLLPQCNHKPRHKSWLTFALSPVFVQRLQKYCTRHVIARETKITFIKLSQSGRGGEVFGKSMLLTVRE